MDGPLKHGEVQFEIIVGRFCIGRASTAMYIYIDSCLVAFDRTRKQYGYDCCRCLCLLVLLAAGAALVLILH